MTIVDPKYREAAKNKEKDWLAKLLDQHATKTKTVTKKVPVEGSDTPAEVKEERPDGVNIDRLFEIAAMNHLDVAKYEGDREKNGFPGRFRMTLANMLRAAAAKRHGLYMPPEGKGTKPVWAEAPKEFLEARKAPETPSEKPNGEKIVKPKPLKADAEQKAEAAPDAAAEGAQ